LLRHREHQTIKNVVFSYSREECRKLIAAQKGQQLNLTNDYRTARSVTLLKTLSMLNLSMLFPYMHIKKGVMMADMPKELLDLCLYCERATFQVPICGTCETCRIVSTSQKIKLPVKPNYNPFNVCSQPY
jgi:hypothetical protein